MHAVWSLAVNTAKSTRKFWHQFDLLYYIFVLWFTYLLEFGSYRHKATSEEKPNICKGFNTKHLSLQNMQPGRGKANLCFLCLFKKYVCSFIQHFKLHWPHTCRLLCSEMNSKKCISEGKTILHGTLLLTCCLTKIPIFSQNVTLFPFFSGLGFCVLLIWFGLWATLLNTAPMVYSGTAVLGLYL